MLRALTAATTSGLAQTLFQHVRPCTGILQHWQLLHSSVSRDPAYSIHNEDDIEYFKSVLGGRGVVDDAAALEPMNRWAAIVLLVCPSVTQQLSTRLAATMAHHLWT